MVEVPMLATNSLLLEFSSNGVTDGVKSRSRVQFCRPALKKLSLILAQTMEVVQRTAAGEMRKAAREAVVWEENERQSILRHAGARRRAHLTSLPL